MAGAVATPVPARPPAVCEAAQLGERWLAWAPGVAAAIILFQTAGHLADWLAFDLRFELFDADSDFCVYAWVATVAIFLSAVGMFVVERLDPRGGLHRLLAAALAFLSLDEMVGIHEHLGRVGVWLGYSEDAGRVVWPLVYLPLIGGVALLLWRFAETTSALGGRYIRAGLVMLGAAVVLEMGSTKLADGQHGRWLYELEVIVEQNLELVGWTLIGLVCAAAAARLLAAQPSS